VAKQIRKNGYAHEGLPDGEEVDAIADGLTEEEVGQILYQIATACDKAGIDGESALRKYASTLVREIEADG
jgi:NTP pyrophosphatase (non-canonical NTP hydrolase)